MKPGSIQGLRTRAACVVSHRYGFLYVTTAKNATSTLRAELTSEHCGGEVLVRSQVEPDIWNRYFTFAFLRDPVVRFLSAYQEISMRMERREVERRPFASMPDDIERFLAFVDDVETHGPWNEHIAPQTAFVEGRRIDFWGRVETIQEDLQRVYARLGIGPCPPLPIRRARREDRYVIRRAGLDAPTIRRITTLYREDIDLIATTRADASEHDRPVRVTIVLTDGSDHCVELSEDHPVLTELEACRPAGGIGAPSIPQLLQIPLDDGTAALSFAPRDLVRLEMRRPGPSPATARALSDRSRRPTIARTSTKPTDGDPQTNVTEGHLGGYLRSVEKRIRGSAAGPHGDGATWYPLLWQWLVEDLGIRSVLDLGCGEGHAAGFFRDAGCDVLGIDGSLLARSDSVIAGRHAVHDFVDGPFVPARRFDLVWSCEFVEHVEERFTHNFLTAIASSRKYVLMTFASPGQRGWHHVNCQRQDYWVEKLRRLGFALDESLTTETRQMAHGHFQSCGLAFVRRDTPTSSRETVGAAEAPIGMAGIRSVATHTANVATSRARQPERPDALTVNSMEIARIEDRPFYLFHDIFVHGTRPRIVAVCSAYGDDWNPAEHHVDYNAVDLVLGQHRVRGRWLRHRLDSWEPCMMLEFEGPEIEGAIRDDEIRFTIEVGSHAQRFSIPTRRTPAFDVAMSLVVRNENRWVRTFLDYYLACLKAEHVFVYDNGTADRTALLSILAPYRARGEVTYIPWNFRWRNRVDRKMTAQPAQETHSLTRFAHCRWLGFFDVDELLRLPHTTLPAFLARFTAAAVDGLSFGTRWFSYRGPLGFDDVEQPPLTYLYARRDELGRKRQKLFVKGGAVRFLRLHTLEDGKNELPIDDTDIFFHHYEQRPGRFENGKEKPGQYDGYMLRFRDRLSRGPAGS